jgi:hypothetical protein
MEVYSCITCEVGQLMVRSSLLVMWSQWQVRSGQ